MGDSTGGWKTGKVIAIIEATMAGNAVFPVIFCKVNISCLWNSQKARVRPLLKGREAMEADLPRTNRDKSKDGRRTC